MDDRSSQHSGSEPDVSELVNHEPEDPNTIITKAPEKRSRLGYLSVMGLVVNRMIGTCAFRMCVGSVVLQYVGRCMEFHCVGTKLLQSNEASDPCREHVPTLLVS